MTMLRYEIQKALWALEGRITLLLFTCVVALSCWTAVLDVECLDAQGQWETGGQAAARLRAACQPWKGLLDEETIRQAIGELNRITAMPAYSSEDYEERNRAYHLLQQAVPFEKLFLYSYAPGFQSLDERVIEKLTPEDAPFFYENRVRLLKEGIYDETKQISRILSERQKQYLIAQYEALETPFFFDYSAGWETLLSHSAFLMLYGSLALGFLVASIFANECRWKADAVFFSSFLGRGRGTAAKLLAGILLVSVLYWLGILIYTLVTLGILGWEGGSCPIQLSYWKSMDRLTFWQAYVLAVVGGYLGNLFIALLAMWVSAKTDSAPVAVTVPFLTILLCGMLKGTSIPWLNQLLALLPGHLMQLSMVLQTLGVYDLGFTVVGRIPVLLVIYSLLTLGLVPAVYRVYGRKGW